MKTIEAQRLVLTDEAGTPRIDLDASLGRGVVMFHLFGKDQASLALLIDSDGCPKVTFTRPDGTEAISIGCTEQLGAGFTLHDAEGRQRFYVTSPVGEAEGSIEILDAQGELIWRSGT